MANVGQLVVTDTFSSGSFRTLTRATTTINKISTPHEIGFVGDVLLARRVETYLDSYGSQYVYSSLPVLSSSTVLVGNFEATIPDVHEHTPDLTFNFSVDKIHISAMREYGFDHMSLANNHSYDNGETSFLHTQKILENNSITPLGSPKEFGTSSVTYIDLQDQTIAVMALYALENAPETHSIKTVLDAATQQSDIQVIYVHWGNEYSATHSTFQQALAHKLIDYGADAIIGHHPHVVQDIELYKEVPIFYSLGNFIFDQYFSTDVQQGLWVTLIPNNDSIIFKLNAITSIGSQSVPRFMVQHENNIFMSELAEKSSPPLKEMIIDGNIILDRNAS